MLKAKPETDTTQLVKRDEDLNNTPADPQTKPDLVDVENIQIVGRVVVNATKPNEQGSYNLLVMNVEGVTILEQLKTEFGFATDDQGQFWIKTTIDPAGKAKLRQAGRTGANKFVVEGLVTLVDVKNAKLEGFMTLNKTPNAVRVANLREGGRIIETVTVDREVAGRQPMGNMGFNRGGRRGA